MEGWIKTHRNIQQHYLWQDKPFSKGQAWIDILLLANHKDNKFILGNEVVEVERGSFVTSEIKLMNRWGWSKSKVRGFLQLLQNDSMIVKKTDTKKTTLKVLNYNVWQDSETTKEPEKDHKKTRKKPQKDTNKNEENEKNEKNEKKIINNVFHEKIINYLNEKSGKNFKSTTKRTLDIINARLNEKFTIEDFKRVIDTKVKEWKDNNEMNKYLRPETLFGNKFEGYLNQSGGVDSGKTKQHIDEDTIEIRGQQVKRVGIYL